MILGQVTDAPTVAQAITRSSAAFMDVVWPAMEPSLGGGEIVPVEDALGSPFARYLDYAGHDYWQWRRDMGLVRLLASRVQWDQWWPTFTIRVITDRGNRDTEYSKKWRALEHRLDGWLLPAITVQAYINTRTDSLHSAAACLDSSLLVYAAHDVVDGNDLLANPRGMGERDHWSFRRNPSGAWFVALWWDWLSSEYGARIVRHGS